MSGDLHDHSGHSHAFSPSGRPFAIGVGLNIAYVVIEAGFGLYSGSLALMADAGHNLSDVLGLIIAWVAMWLATKPPGPRRTYGYKRTPILASLANAVLLGVAVGAILWEAVWRLSNPRPIEFNVVLWVAIAGIFVNGVTTWLFASGGKHDLNVRGAFLHMAADTAVTIGVVFAALAIRWTSWNWIDPGLSIVIALVVLIGTWNLLRSAVMLSIDAVPAHIDPIAVRAYLLDQAGVGDVHDLHIWPLSTTEVALTAHLVCDDAARGQGILRTLPTVLRERFEIHHTTIQIESRETAARCSLRPASVV